MNDSCIELPFPYYYRNLVLATPIDTSGETSSAQAGDAERADVLRFLLVMVNPNPGYDNPCAYKKQPTNGCIGETENSRLRECFGDRLRKKSSTSWNKKNETLHEKRTRTLR
jgi:hypothetical protein